MFWQRYLPWYLPWYNEARGWGGTHTLLWVYVVCVSSPRSGTQAALRSVPGALTPPPPMHPAGGPGGAEPNGSKRTATATSPPAPPPRAQQVAPETPEPDGSKRTATAILTHGTLSPPSAATAGQGGRMATRLHSALGSRPAMPTMTRGCEVGVLRYCTTGRCHPTVQTVLWGDANPRYRGCTTGRCHPTVQGLSYPPPSSPLTSPPLTSPPLRCPCPACPDLT